jgi:hypothetical protein
MAGVLLICAGLAMLFADSWLKKWLAAYERRTDAISPNPKAKP